MIENPKLGDCCIEVTTLHNGDVQYVPVIWQRDFLMYGLSIGPRWIALETWFLYRPEWKNPHTEGRFEHAQWAINKYQGSQVKSKTYIKCP